uniref:Alliinase C-terminal domain-containing protein n=1 Tax=Aegilops tauschii subsp. strangulata TaxID=200361 RepID=A0A452Y3W7_AEGTS
LFQAAMYALSPPGAERPVGVVSRAPYYSVIKIKRSKCKFNYIRVVWGV